MVSGLEITPVFAVDPPAPGSSGADGGRLHDALLQAVGVDPRTRSIVAVLDAPVAAAAIRQARAPPQQALCSSFTSFLLL